MRQDHIDATLSAADQQAVLQAIQTIRQKLPFLIDVSPEERQAMVKFGDRSQAFVERAATVAAQSSDFLPRSFDVEEMQRDVALLQALQPIRTALLQRNELIDDTYFAVGSDAYAAALDGVVDDLGRRFARKSRQQPPQDEPPVEL